MATDPAGLCGAGEAVLDAAPLELLRRAHSVDHHPPIGQFDPPVVRRHRMGQWLHVRLQQYPVMVERRDPVLRQPAVRATGSPTTQPPRFLLHRPHTVRVASPAARA